MKRSKHGLFVFPPKKTLIWKSIVRLANRVNVAYDVKAKYRLISKKFSGNLVPRPRSFWGQGWFSGIKFFHPSVRLTNQKPRAFISVR